MVVSLTNEGEAAVGGLTVALHYDPALYRWALGISGGGGLSPWAVWALAAALAAVTRVKRRRLSPPHPRTYAAAQRVEATTGGAAAGAAHRVHAAGDEQGGAWGKGHCPKGSAACLATLGNLNKALWFVCPAALRRWACKRGRPFSAHPTVSRPALSTAGGPALPEAGLERRRGAPHGRRAAWGEPPRHVRARAHANVRARGRDLRAPRTPGSCNGGICSWGCVRASLQPLASCPYCPTCMCLPGTTPCKHRHG